jgi:DNA polymerase III alpha subunit
MQTSEKMQKNKFGEMIFCEDDIVDYVMRGAPIQDIKGMLVDSSVDIETGAAMLINVPEFVQYDAAARESLTQEQFDHRCQSTWFMPQEYRDLDIAKYVVELCHTEAELQRVGQELLMYQERGLFDLLRYLKFLVDTMQANNLIWGVGRGSSVASYVLYLLGVHRIDSIYYNLDPAEFLR